MTAALMDGGASLLHMNMHERMQGGKKRLTDVREASAGATGKAAAGGAVKGETGETGETGEGSVGGTGVAESALCEVVRAGNLGVAAVVLKRDPCVSRHRCRRRGQGHGQGGGEGGRDMFLTVEVRPLFH